MDFVRRPAKRGLNNVVNISAQNIDMFLSVLVGNFVLVIVCLHRVGAPAIETLN